MVVFGNFIDPHANVNPCLQPVHNLSISGVSTKLNNNLKACQLKRSMLRKHEIGETHTYLLPESYKQCNLQLPCMNAEQQ